MSLLLVLLVEGALRLGGRPEGHYVAGLLEGIAWAGGPWEPGYDGLIQSGPVSYRVRANAAGFRGPELRPASDPADLRIVAIGDSFTEGFYVDNADTYPFRLQLALEADGLDAEVINAARGGGSMDRFGELLERCVLPLQPDLVLVTFVSNDLSDLGWFPLETQTKPPLEGLASLFVGRTAIGECMLDALLPSKPFTFGLSLDGPCPTYMIEEESQSPIYMDQRYQIAAGEQYSANAGLFMQRYGSTDGLVLDRSLSPLAQRAFGIYREELGSFVNTCRGQGIRVLLIYVPAYPEIYVERPLSAGRRLLAAEAEELGIGFVDLTDSLKEASLEQGWGALHLAPLDFHLNPRGNYVVAAGVAQALVEQGLLEKESK